MAVERIEEIGVEEAKKIATIWLNERKASMAFDDIPIICAIDVLVNKTVSKEKVKELLRGIEESL